MIIEAISFKLCLDFLKYLKKNRIYSDNIRLNFYDRNKHQFTTFDTIDEMQVYYDEAYLTPDVCELGSIVSIQSMNATSDLYDFDITYRALDLTTLLYNVKQGVQFDIQRNSQRDIFKQRQLTMFNKTVTEYSKFFNELKYIYVTGIYSPCYAEPGWSENTWLLNSLKIGLLDPSNSSQFPYKNTNISRRPPN